MLKDASYRVGVVDLIVQGPVTEPSVSDDSGVPKYLDRGSLTLDGRTADKGNPVPGYDKAPTLHLTSKGFFEASVRAAVPTGGVWVTRWCRGTVVKWRILR